MYTVVRARRCGPVERISNRTEMRTITTLALSESGRGPGGSATGYASHERSAHGCYGVVSGGLLTLPEVVVGDLYKKTRQFPETNNILVLRDIQNSLLNHCYY